jgi:hypothetical protein
MLEYQDLFLSSRLRTEEWRMDSSGRMDRKIEAKIESKIGRIIGSWIGEDGFGDRASAIIAAKRASRISGRLAHCPFQVLFRVECLSSQGYYHRTIRE